MKYCKDCMEYSCGARGSDNVSQICGDNETYFYHTESDEEAEYETELMNRAYDNFITIHQEKEDKRTMKKENIFDDHTILDDIIEEIDQLRNALMLGEFPTDVALQYKNTAYGLDYAECIIMKYKKAMREKED